jgi:secreted PhoX family phosphatase
MDSDVNMGKAGRGVASRRQFLRTAGAVSLGFVGLQRLTIRSPFSASASSARIDKFGPLVRDPNGVMDLPKGFTYQVMSSAGQTMTDGLIVPGAHDGMAAFAGPNGLTILVRNHEVAAGRPARHGAFGSTNELFARRYIDLVYDPGRNDNPCLGGTTTLVYDTRTRRLERSFLSLGGTLRNCAGGPTPWNTWITCEETVDRANQILARDHGYCFEVPVSDTPTLAKAIPLTALGRFNHEAVAVEPRSGIVYQTEDRPDGVIYRLVPEKPGDIREGGRLQVLCVKDQRRLDTRNWDKQRVKPGTVLETRWVEVDHIDSPGDDLRYQAFDRGAARFARGEGMWYGREAVYFACTNGGRQKLGQVWRYVPSPAEGTSDEQDRPGRLELFIEPNDGALVENCDNVTVTPWGDLILCENGPGDEFLVGVTPAGEIYRLGRNALDQQDLAGATFAPDGSTLFVNIQGRGVTLAITGPWNG